MVVVGLILSTVGLDFIQVRNGLLSVRHTSGWHRFGAGGHGRFRDRRGLDEHRKRGKKNGSEDPDQEFVAQPGGVETVDRPIIRGSVLGFPLGILPGGGAIIASFLSYGVEKRISKHPEEVRKGGHRRGGRP